MKFNKLYKELLGENMKKGKGHVIVPKSVSNKVAKIIFYWDKSEQPPKVPKDVRDLQFWDGDQNYIALRDVEFENRGNINVAIIDILFPEKVDYETLQHALNSFIGEFPLVQHKFQMVGQQEPSIN